MSTPQATARPRLRDVPILGLTVAAIALSADQLSKYLIVEHVMRPPGVTETPYIAARVIEITPFFDLRLSWNPGISFSLFNSGSATTIAVLTAVQIILSVLLIIWLWRQDRPWLQIVCGLIIGGAIGNVIDRVTLGVVTDFLSFHWRGWYFPTFNLADTSITVGAGLWLLDAAIVGQHHGDGIKGTHP